MLWHLSVCKHFVAEGIGFEPTWLLHRIAFQASSLDQTRTSFHYYFYVAEEVGVEPTSRRITPTSPFQGDELSLCSALPYINFVAERARVELARQFPDDSFQDCLAHRCRPLHYGGSGGTRTHMPKDHSDGGLANHCSAN